jgi:hypothetical protein
MISQLIKNNFGYEKWCDERIQLGELPSQSNVVRKSERETGQTRSQPMSFACDVSKRQSLEMLIPVSVFIARLG